MAQETPLPKDIKLAALETIQRGIDSISPDAIDLATVDGYPPTNPAYAGIYRGDQFARQSLFQGPESFNELNSAFSLATRSEAFPQIYKVLGSIFTNSELPNEPTVRGATAYYSIFHTLAAITREQKVPSRLAKRILETGTFTAVDPEGQELEMQINEAFMSSHPSFLRDHIRVIVDQFASEDNKDQNAVSREVYYRTLARFSQVDEDHRLSTFKLINRQSIDAQNDDLGQLDTQLRIDQGSLLDILDSAGFEGIQLLVNQVNSQANTDQDRLKNLNQLIERNQQYLE